MGLWPAFSIGKKLLQSKFFRGPQASGLLNHAGDVNVGIQDFSERFVMPLSFMRCLHWSRRHVESTGKTI